MYKKNGKVVAIPFRECYNSDKGKEHMKKFCPKCGKMTEVIKYGNRNGNQRYRCCDKSCRRQFFESANFYSCEIKYLASMMYKKLPCRVIAKLLGIKSHNSICYWEKNPLKERVNQRKLLEYIERLKAPYEKATELQGVKNSISAVERELLEAKSFKEDWTIEEKRAQLEKEIKTLKERREEIEKENDSALAQNQFRTQKFYDIQNSVWLIEEDIKAKKEEIAKLNKPKPNIDEIINRLEARRQEEEELTHNCTITGTLFDYSPTIFKLLCKISEGLKSEIRE